MSHVDQYLGLLLSVEDAIDEDGWGQDPHLLALYENNHGTLHSIQMPGWPISMADGGTVEDAVARHAAILNRAQPELLRGAFPADQFRGLLLVCEARARKTNHDGEPCSTPVRSFFLAPTTRPPCLMIRERDGDIDTLDCRHGAAVIAGLQSLLNVLVRSGVDRVR